MCTLQRENTKVLINNEKNIILIQNRILLQIGSKPTFFMGWLLNLQLEITDTYID